MSTGMRAIWVAGLLSSLLITGTAFGSPDAPPPQSNQGLTVEGLARGVKSAAKNIEQEIPKVGAAIGNTVQTMMGKGSGRTSPSPAPARDKK